MIGCGNQSGCLLLGQELNWTMLTTFAWNRQNTLTLQAQCGLLNRNELEEGVHGSQAGVACSNRVASFLLEMMEKPFDQMRIEFLEQELGGHTTRFFRCKGQQQPERVAIARHCVGTDSLLFEQSLGEESLNQWG